MPDKFFELSSPRDILEKAKRDFSTMVLHLDTYTIFDFFVTVYHVKDYVEVQGKASEPDIKKFCNEQDFQMCEYVCNKGKHLELTRKHYPYQTQHRKAAVFGEVMFNEVTFGQSESYGLIAGGKEVDVVALGKRLLDNWERFFRDKGI